MAKATNASFVLPLSRGSLSPPSTASGPRVSSSTPSTSGTNDSVVYELVPLRELPILDPTKTVKSLLFTPSQMNTINRVSYKGRLWLSLMFLVGNLTTFAIMTMPARHGRWLSVLAVLLQLPGMVFTTLAIRYEMLRLLVRTYDFWFFSVANFMFAVSFVILLNDLRILALLNGAYLIQLGIIADAQLGDLKALVVSSMFNIVCHIMLFSLVLFRFVDESERVVMLRYSHQHNVITTRDMLLNSMINMVVLFTRLWYRKRAALKECATSTGRHNEPTTSTLFAVNTKCVSYRCHVRLREKASRFASSAVTTTLVESIVPAPQPQPFGSGSGSFSLTVQLQYSKVPRAFVADDTILARLSRGRIRPSGSDFSDSDDATDLTRSKRGRVCRLLLLTILYSCGFVGLLCLSVAWTTSWFSIPTGNKYLLHVLSTGGTAIFCGTFVACHQVRLVLQLFKSFDFVFLTVKILIGVLCALSFLQWDHKVLTLGTSFMWMYWLLSLDALTPTARAWLGFRIQYASVVAVAVITIQVMFFLDFLWLDQITATDVILFQDDIFGKSVEIHAMSAFLSQLWTILAWFCRILWRILWISGEDEMIMLLGQVGYDNYMYERKRRRRRMHILQRKLAAKHPRSTLLSRKATVTPAPAPVSPAPGDGDASFVAARARANST